MARHLSIEIMDTFEIDTFDEDDSPLLPMRPSPLSGPSPRQRRGSVVQLSSSGGDTPRRSAALSLKGELQATLVRLREAERSGDVNEMHAALTAVGGRMPAIGGVAVSTMQGRDAREVQRLAMSLAVRMTENDTLKEVANLRRNGDVRANLLRLWGLMVVESTCIAQEAGDDAAELSVGGKVTREGYRALHVRIAKVLAEAHRWDEESASVQADKGWAEDIYRFSGTSHITVWLDEIRSSFRAAAARAVAEHGFAQLFADVDTDGSGEIDFEEFTAAVRTNLDIDPDIVRDNELFGVFTAVDADGSGEVDAQEFTQWLDGTSPAGSSEDKLRQRFKIKSQSAVESIGWQKIFEKYDDDKSGELELDEFTNAVRMECGLSPDSVSDEQIEELFGVIDADESGAIDADELQDLLSSDLDEAAMTFKAFFSSVFERELACWQHPSFLLPSSLHISVRELLSF